MKAYVSIDDGKFPTFNLSQDKTSTVEIEATRRKIAAWKAAFTAYGRVQKELEDLVNHYEPARLKAPRPDKGKFTDVRSKTSSPG